MPRSPITTHVLDVSRGKPASGIAVTLEGERNGGYQELGRGETDVDGRVNNLLPEGTLDSGVYRISFNVQSYQAAQKVKSFYPHVSITFTVEDGTQHYHVPLLLSPYGYSTYRGS